MEPEKHICYLPRINAIAEIYSASVYIHCSESLKHDNIDSICLHMLDVHTSDFVTS